MSHIIHSGPWHSAFGMLILAWSAHGPSRPRADQASERPDGVRKSRPSGAIWSPLAVRHSVVANGEGAMLKIGPDGRFLTEVSRTRRDPGRVEFRAQRPRRAARADSLHPLIEPDVRLSRIRLSDGVLTTPTRAVRAEPHEVLESHIPQRRPNPRSALCPGH